MAILVAVVVTLAAILGLMAVSEREEKRSPLAIDAAPPTVTLGAASSSVNLAPVDLPKAAEVDAADFTPLEPVPAIPAASRHLRGKGK